MTGDYRTSYLPLDPEVLRDIQRDYASRVVEQRLAKEPRVIAAVDMHLAGADGIAVAVSMVLPDLEHLETKVVKGEIDFPYVPGFLAFREAPLCIEAVRLLDRQPDLLLVDGHGKAHPLGCGVACHVGVELDLPTIGVAKSRLVGSHDDPRPGKGSRSELRFRGAIVGTVLRTRSAVRPVFVSVGNLITLPEAVQWTLELARRYRLPEPSHLAHRLASEHSKMARENTS